MGGEGGNGDKIKMGTGEMAQNQVIWDIKTVNKIGTGEMDTKSGDKFKKSVDKMACVEMDTNSGVMFTKTVDKIWPCRYVHNIWR